jgi:two-component sensor histidine kinase
MPMRLSSLHPSTPLPAAWQRYLLAVAAFALGFLVRLGLTAWLPHERGIIIFVPAVVVTTFLAGSGPGILTAVLAALATTYLFVRTGATAAALVTDLVVFGTVIAVTNWLCISIRRLEVEIAERSRAEDALKGSVLREKLLVGELQHRTKNLFALIEALAIRSLNRERPFDEMKQSFLGRLAALGVANERLLAANMRGASLKELIESEMAPYQGRYTVEGEDALLDPKTAQDFSLALYELATNAVKYGALSAPEGRVTISVGVRSNGAPVLRFSWIESGGPPVSQPQRKGFGTLLLQATLGRGTIEYDPQGLRYTVSTRLDRSANMPGSPPPVGA